MHYDYMFKYEQSLVWVDFKNLKKEGKLVVESEFEAVVILMY